MLVSFFKILFWLVQIYCGYILKLLMRPDLKLWKKPSMIILQYHRKNLEQIIEIMQNSTEKENLDICLCAIFTLSFQGLISGRETRS